MKIILKIVIVLVIVVCIITLLRIVEFKKYESLVDEDLYKQLVLMEENKKYYQNRLIIPSKDRPFVSNEAFWDNQLVRLRVELAVETKDDVSYDYIYDVVEIKDSPPSDWRQLLRKIDFCEYATVWKSQLFCISSGGNIRLNVVQSTSEYREIQLVGHTSIGNYDPFVDNNFLYIVWVDDRIHWFNPLKIFNVLSPSDSDYIGPYLVMAGKLNLDTLEFTEHVIKFDSNDFP